MSNNFEIELKKLILQNSRMQLNIDDIKEDSNLLDEFGYDSVSYD